MKNTLFISIILSAFLFLSKADFLHALDVNLNLARANTDQTSASPSSTISPTTTPSQTGEPSPTRTPSVSPSISGSVSIGVTLTTTPASISATIEPSTTIKPTATSESNIGGTKTVTPTPSTSVSPTASPTPSGSPTPTPTLVPVQISNTQPPANKVAEQLYKRLIVPPLSFLFHQPPENFYQDNKLAKNTSYGLLGLATLSLISGSLFLFPDKFSGLYNSIKRKIQMTFNASVTKNILET